MQANRYLENELAVWHLAFQPDASIAFDIYNRHKHCSDTVSRIESTAGSNLLFKASKIVAEQKVNLDEVDQLDLVSCSVAFRKTGMKVIEQIALSP